MPIVDLILGIEPLAKSGTVLDFQNKTIQNDHVKLAIRPFNSVARKSKLSTKAFQTHDTYIPNGPSTFVRVPLEPISTK